MAVSSITDSMTVYHIIKELLYTIDLPALDTGLATNTAEILAARKTKADLEAQIDFLQSQISSIAAGSGVLIDLTDSVGVLEDKLTGTLPVSATVTGEEGDRTLDISVATGTTEGDLVQVLAGGKLPVLNGENLTNVSDTGLAASQGSITISERTENTLLDIDDRLNWIKITSGTFTQTIDSAVTLTDKWICYIENSGTGDITISPHGTETIDGLDSFIMYPGEIRLLICDGTNLKSVVLNSFYKTFTTSGSFVKPPGYSAFEGLLWGGGSSGTCGVGPGGDGGPCLSFVFASSLISETETVTIGAGGAAVIASGPSLPGGSSTFVKSTSGIQSLIGSTYAGGSGGAIATVGDAAIYGGGGGGGSGSGGSTHAGGTSLFGGAGGTGVYGSTLAGSGEAPGGGGGANAAGGTSGAGARGELRIWGKI